MKTTMIRLMVTMVTLAAVIIATIPSADAQGRTIRDKNTRREIEPGKNVRNNINFKENNSQWSTNRKFRSEKNIEIKTKDGRIPESSLRNQKGQKKYSSHANEKEWNTPSSGWAYKNRFDDLHRDRNYYKHPHYGHVIRHFDSRPLAFKYNHGRLYYRDGLFFNYFPRVGYVVVNYPFNQIFTSLPFGATRIVFRGHPYFRIGDLYFEVHRHGYRLVPFSKDIYRYRFPGEVYISGKF